MRYHVCNLYIMKAFSFLSFKHIPKYCSMLASMVMHMLRLTWLGQNFIPPLDGNLNYLLNTIL